MFSLERDKICIRKFNINDVENKVKWINDSANNKYLHYNLPLEYEKTIEWFKRTESLTTRLDAVIEYEGIPVGLIGLLGIDMTNKKAEYYICMGEQNFKGRGIAKTASNLLVEYAFETLGLNKIYLYTERENDAAQKLFEKLGFEKEGLLKEDIIYNGRKVDRYVYGITREVWKNDTNS